MTNSQIFRQIIDAFDTKQYQQFLDLLHENVEWTMVGGESFHGKAAVLAMFDENADNGSMEIQSSRLIIDGDTAASTGVAHYTDPEGKRQTMDYCDVYELEGGLIRRMSSYVVTRKEDKAE